MEGLREAGRSSSNSSSQPRESGDEKLSDMADRWVDLNTLYLQSASIGIPRVVSPVERYTSSPGCRIVGNQNVVFRCGRQLY